MEGALKAVTGVRPHRTDEEKRRMVEGALALGVGGGDGSGALG
jgi:hypothetical protein